MSRLPAHIIVIGRFPPPPDGQSVATLRLAEQLQAETTIHRVNTMIPAEASHLEKLGHYRQAGKRIGNLLDQHPEALVIWTSISPETAGHLRDVATVFPHLKGRRVIAVAHWGKFATVFENKATRATARRLLPTLNRVVFTASLLSEACAEWLPVRRRAVIPNTLDAALIPDTASVADRIGKGRNEPFRVLFLSNMIREKGWEDVLEAAALLNDEGFVCQWVFAGGWPHTGEQERFESKVRELDLTDHVRHRGPLMDRSQIAHEYLEADLFVLPSWLREAQPLSIMEAMAAGTPCVVADDGGMPGLVGANSDDAAGLTVPARDPEAISAAIAKLSHDVTWERAARSARARFESYYAPQVVAHQWIDLIGQVTQEGDMA